jgi:hypothetical protein
MRIDGSDNTNGQECRAKRSKKQTKIQELYV